MALYNNLRQGDSVDQCLGVEIIKRHRRPRLATENVRVRPVVGDFADWRFSSESDTPLVFLCVPDRHSKEIMLAVGNRIPGR